MIEYLSGQKLEDVLTDDLTIVDFFANWCGPCKMLSPIVEQVANENENIKVCKINTDTEPALAFEYKIMSIPTLISFKDGVLYKKSIGLVSKDEILDLVK